MSIDPFGLISSPMCSQGELIRCIDHGLLFNASTGNIMIFIFYIQLTGQLSSGMQGQTFGNLFPMYQKNPWLQSLDLLLNFLKHWSHCHNFNQILYFFTFSLNCFTAACFWFARFISFSACFTVCPEEVAVFTAIYREWMLRSDSYSDLYLLNKWSKFEMGAQLISFHCKHIKSPNKYELDYRITFQCLILNLSLLVFGSCTETVLLVKNW